MRAPLQVLVLPYRRSGTRLEVGVLHRSDHDLWQFISGGAEVGETAAAAARREAREEAGLPDTLRYEPLATTTMLPACWFAAWPTWPAELLVVPEQSFAVDIGSHDLALSAEHRARRWLGYDEAIRLLSFDSNKTALWELHERLYPGPHVKRNAFDTIHAGCCPCSAAAG
jgi:dihydroneopterin triphosphate diphosphatase